MIDSTANRGAMLQTSGGESVPIVDGELLGYARTGTDEEGDTVSIIGWALDASAPDAATTILVFQNHQLVFSGTPDTERQDVADAYPQWALSTPGFNFVLPLAKFDDSEVRVFALSETGTASELRYIRENWILPSARRRCGEDRPQPGFQGHQSVVAWIGAEMEFALSQAVASGDAFEHRPSECGHCVQNFLADLDLRDLPGEAAGFELGADHALPPAICVSIRLR